MWYFVFTFVIFSLNNIEHSGLSVIDVPCWVNAKFEPLDIPFSLYET